jgi:tRNA-uridine 2-sulfurtransferase
MAQKMKVAVGMSGGVDSSVAAALLIEQGCEVVGFTLFLRDGALKCVSEADVETAAAVANDLGIEHHVIDARREFEARIVRYFAAEYASGRTPSPCVLCNPTIKFGLLFERAAQLGCERMATGHYARIERDGDGLCHLFKNPDARKDQSYFLQRLRQDQLSRTIFPLAEWTKERVRACAAARGLRCAAHSESQDLCFAEQGGYAELVESIHPSLAEGGDIVDLQGNSLGRHPGIHHFTVGQRRGPGVAVGERYYVARIDGDSQRVVMGPRADCSCSECTITDVNWIAGAEPESLEGLILRPRYRHPGAEGALTRRGGAGAYSVQFKESQFAIAPGQALAVYAGDELLGGGWIE